ncbi:OadG family transporter subunit [Desulfallas thermosapovorans]|uniref:Oxaloacetate decarboxylase gamma subunit n=1 Tax=Desulfallas thermosapovorans DSM 6562 TaxID=1121431 RepID=A0A5S4ZV13_9FIRM|nr:OadG family transporter subunit [Desulfallas thermosapovorans]TYO96555.1 oxaloacetate decarboxylase gamma subunit [Desulfallas thermosapovorans DSM 6562]
MVDWGMAASVAISGIVSVFAVLIMLQIGVQITGMVIDSQAKKQSQKQNT